MTSIAPKANTRLAGSALSSCWAAFWRLAPGRFHSSRSSEAGTVTIRRTHAGVTPGSPGSCGHEGRYPPTLHTSILPDPPVAKCLPSAEMAISEIFT